MRAILFASAMAVALAGCGKPPPPTPVSDIALLPKDGMAKVIVYYPHARLWKGNKVDVVVNNAITQKCRMTTGHFLTRDVPPGDVPISASLCNGNGVTRFILKAEAGKTYYLQVMPKDDSIEGRIAARGTKTNPLPDPPPADPIPKVQLFHAEGTAFYIDLMDESYARPRIDSLRLTP